MVSKNTMMCLKFVSLFQSNWNVFKIYYILSSHVQMCKFFFLIKFLQLDCLIHNYLAAGLELVVNVPVDS